MSNIANKPADATSADNLRRTFETAFAELQHQGEPAKASIAVRNRAITQATWPTKSGHSPTQPAPSRCCGTSLRAWSAEELHMLRALAAYLLVFWLLGLVVHLGGLVHLFGVTALALFAIDLLTTNPTGSPPASSTRGRLLR
jgi:hypothetical protein